MSEELKDIMGYVDRGPHAEDRIIKALDNEELIEVGIINPETWSQEGFWLFRCGNPEKQTKKALGVNMAGQLCWIPKSVVRYVLGPRGRESGGFIVKEWWGEQHAQSGGPLARVNRWGDLI